MIHLRAVVGVLALVLLAGGLLQGQEKKDDKKDTPTKIKGVLPANWGKLGLTDEQKQKVYKVQAEYKDKIADLDKQIKELKDKEKSEMAKVLSDEQKKRLNEILTGKVPGDDKKDDKKEERKP